MVRISKEKIDRIKSNILSHLFEIFPKTLFIAEISRLEARDEEFIKRLMIELGNAGLVVGINKNSKGVFYSRRQRWRLSNKAHEAYKQHI
jgi:predicted transcriptional regulator with HTH domain